MAMVSKYVSSQVALLWKEFVPKCALFSIGRDPSQHGSLQDAIEQQSTALYATARLWDDGIIRPTDTRSVLGLALALSSTLPACPDAVWRTWDGDEKGFGVFRM